MEKPNQPIPQYDPVQLRHLLTSSKTQKYVITHNICIYTPSKHLLSVFSPHINMYKDNRAINNTLLDFVLNKKKTDLRKYSLFLYCRSLLSLNICPCFSTHTVNLPYPVSRLLHQVLLGNIQNEIWCDLYLQQTSASSSLHVCLC